MNAKLFQPLALSTHSIEIEPHRLIHSSRSLIACLALVPRVTSVALSLSLSLCHNREQDCKGASTRMPMSEQTRGPTITQSSHFHRHYVHLPSIETNIIVFDQ